MDKNEFFLGEDKIPRILIVDDNPHNLQVLGMLLQENNYEIEFAINGDVALRWLEANSFDLLILDINMPGMGGFEVCQIIRSNPKKNNMPIIFLTADSDRDSLFKGFELGAQDYITKPVDSRELLVRVRTHLSLKFSLENQEKQNKILEERVVERTKELVIAKERAERSDKLKTEFLNNISHEIRTPLNGILGFATAVIQPDISTEEREELLIILEKSSERLLTTITNYMDISLIVSGNVIPDIVPLGFHELLEIVDCNAQKKCRGKNLELIIENSVIDSEMKFRTDKKLLQKALMHIVDNAVKYTISGKIIIGYELVADNVIFYVKDTGIGIEPDKLLNITKTFYQGDSSSSRKHEGSGLGLSIANGLVELLGGKIVIESKINRGTIVKIIFGEFQ